MSVQARQALRLMKFVAEMKKNNYPNAGSFAKLLREMDINENMDCACSSRTVLRDIEILQKEYHAPIAYDAVRRGYYLKNRDWEFSVPIMGDELDAAGNPTCFRSSSRTHQDRCHYGGRKGADR